MTKLILESIRTWIASCQSIKVMARLELHWMELDALSAFPAFEEFLAIIFFERQRDICVAQLEASELTADEKVLLDTITIARWDQDVAARVLRCLLGDASADAAARAAARVGFRI